MRVLEHTSDRLVFRTGVPLLNVSHCELDRRSGEARFVWTILRLPRKRITSLLTDIADAQCASFYTKMQGSTQETKIPRIVLASKQTINLAVGSFDTRTAPKVVALVKEFLEL